jgi:hypothetical protein
MIVTILSFQVNSILKKTKISSIQIIRQSVFAVVSDLIRSFIASAFELPMLIIIGFHYI